MLTVVLILVILGCCLIVWFRRNNNEEPPALNGYFPLIGHAHLLIGAGNIHLWIYLKEIAYECLNAGGVMSIFHGPKTVYCVADPDDFLTVADTCLQKDCFNEFAKPWLGDGLATSDLTTWKEHRKLLDPAFSQAFTDGFLTVFNKQARRLVKELEVKAGKGTFDHFVYTRKNALETTFFTVFGEDFNDKSFLSIYQQKMDQMLNILVERFKKPWLHCDYIYRWSALRKQQDDCMKILLNISNTVLKKKKAVYLNNGKNQNIKKETNGPKFKAFIDLLLELAIEKDAFNDEEIREHVDTLMFGGHDTVASVLMYTILLVGSYSGVQKKILEELQSIFGDSNRDVTRADLSQLVYLEAVINESMRIYPIMPISTRRLDRDVQLKNCTLKKGRTCLLFIFGVNRHPMWGPDAEKFKPERWLGSTTPDCPTAIAGFGVGRRVCIGNVSLPQSLPCDGRLTLSAATLLWLWVRFPQLEKCSCDKHECSVDNKYLSII
ncbi:jg12307 [Pararge aegeria aegeria]|uniref:Jg12307 protein n=1 Tax=Pararge aegeria aegeria TaxID=348720 RepID=A0A8S4RHX6_9NEOP|nr:jg12307 [Pararge aegeria aegeria]